MSIWIYTDADNTLWDTNAVFAEAQLALLNLAEDLSGVHHPINSRVEFVREVDQAIAARHHARLRYPPALLLRALRERLGGLSPEAAAQRVLAQGSVPTESETTGLCAYSRILSRVPPLLPGVRDGLELASKQGMPVYVITEGPIELVRTRLQRLELAALTTGALSAAKTPGLFARLKQRAAPHSALMIGDQPDRDIRFAHEAGLKTILVIGSFRPRWAQLAETDLADSMVDNFLDAIKQAIQWNALSQCNH